ncbi:hypothetical protein FQN54_005020 [Arachnomyces sp. PD_36]|nr:hypothetical protein FQN54_005020 [Arachnomyces sp. PD_36]
MAPPPQTASGVEAEGHQQGLQPAPEPTPTGKKRGRTNTPWTAEEEHRLKTMRDAGSSWSEIAKTFPTRTEGSVKKHWYKDMHYAEFAEDESIALRDAIKEYEANKWKVIGQKVGKPAKVRTGVFEPAPSRAASILPTNTISRHASNMRKNTLKIFSDDITTRRRSHDTG